MLLASGEGVGKWMTKGTEQFSSRAVDLFVILNVSRKTGDLCYCSIKQLLTLVFSQINYIIGAYDQTVETTV